MENPFIITGGIPAKYFCDRRKESDMIVKTLSNGGNLCMISPRRMGKSKLVKFCYDQKELSENYYTFYIDILHTSSLREFTFVFGQEVFGVLHTKSQKMLSALIHGLKSINGRFGFDPATGSPTFSLSLGDIETPEFTLKEIFDCLENADKPCIVTFDEFQQIAYYPEKNIEALLRSHIQHLSNVHFILSGSERHLVSEMFMSSSRPFYNSTSIIDLLPIDIKEYASFVSHWFVQNDRTIDEKLVEYVYHLFEGNTYCIQKTFHEAFANTPVKGTCTTEIIKQTVEGILEEAGSGYSKILSRIPERQKELLYAISAEGRAEKILSVAFIHKHSLTSSSAVQAAARKLQKEDLITQESLTYYIPDPMFRLYLLSTIEKGKFVNNFI